MTQKPKKPPPEVGRRVRLRGRMNEGVLKALGRKPTWAHVEWDRDDGPKWCHINELESAES